MLVTSTVDDPMMRRWTEAVLQHLNRDLFDVSVVRIFDKADTGTVPADVAQYALGADVQTARDLGLGDPDISQTHPAEYGWLAGLAGGLVGLAQEARADVVLGHGLLAAAVVGIAEEWLPAEIVTAAGLNSAPLVDWGGGEHSELYRSLLHARLRKLDLAFCTEEGGCGQLVAAYGVDPSRTMVFRPPVEMATPETGEPAPGHELFDGDAAVFVCVARGMSSDAVRCVLGALAIARRREDVRCVVVDAASDDESWLQGASALAVSEGVVLVPGTLGLSRYLEHAVALVNQSDVLDTTVPNPVVMATASGCPVISTRGSDSSYEYLGAGSRCLPVPAGDSDALAEAMLTLAWDRALSKDIADLARTYFESVSAVRQIHELEERLSN
jgi:glycosyltransferase involved in cell wall biosynthesis